MEDASNRGILNEEFERAAEKFAERTIGRFDNMDIVEFSRLPEGGSVAEVGAGTGNFLALFADRAGLSVAVDLTDGMLRQAAVRHPHEKLVVGDGARLPLGSGSFDVVASAQMLHHVHEPMPILKEMRRVAGADGAVLIVDQVATENYEEVQRLNELEILRDPSHATSRPPSAFRVMVLAAGLEIVDEKIVSSEQRLSSWMWPGEFPEERIEAVKRLIEAHGHETGKGFERDGGDWVFTRRRIAILAERA
jgi:ubiquinone/menaquinone biosynthesis C-methylase UbiE